MRTHDLQRPHLPRHGRFAGHRRGHRPRFRLGRRDDRPRRRPEGQARRGRPAHHRGPAAGPPSSPADVSKLDQATAVADRGRQDVRPDRSSRQQRRHHPRQPLHADEGRGVGRRHGRQPQGRLQLLQGRHPEHDPGPLRADRQPVLRRRGHGQRRPDQLLRLQGRADRLHQVAGPRGRRPEHHRQLRRPRLHRHGHDREAARSGQDRPSWPGSRCSASGTPRTSPGPCGSSARTTPPTSPARSSTSTAACIRRPNPRRVPPIFGRLPWKETNC